MSRQTVRHHRGRCRPRPQEISLPAMPPRSTAQRCPRAGDHDACSPCFGPASAEHALEDAVDFPRVQRRVHRLVDVRLADTRPAISGSASSRCLKLRRAGVRRGLSWRLPGLHRMAAAPVDTAWPPAGCRPVSAPAARRLECTTPPSASRFAAILLGINRQPLHVIPASRASAKSSAMVASGAITRSTDE